MNFRFFTRFLAVLFFFALSLSGIAADDVAQFKSCSYCGMDRGEFSHSRMLIEYDDGSMTGTCSLHCTSLDLALNIGKAPAVIKAANFGTGELLSAEEAFWVIGGGRKGVMTRRAKWAFSKKAEAESFIHEHGGSLATFEEAVRASYEDMYEDTKMIRTMRKEKMKGRHMH